jgi:hypothetical protein
VPTEIDTWKLPKGDELGYALYDSPISSYEASFASVLDGKHITDLLSGISSPTVIDLMSSSAAVADLFSQISAPNMCGIAVSLEDVRTKAEELRDEKLGVSQIVGNVTSPETWEEKIKLKLRGRKADLIMERALFVQDIPDKPLLYGALLQRMWDLLSSNGILLLQLPYTVNRTNVDTSLVPFVAALTENGIETRFDVGKKGGGALFIQRSPTSPERLPLSMKMAKEYLRAKRISISHGNELKTKTLRERLGNFLGGFIRRGKL